MDTIQFEGQQDGERVLYCLKPHPLVKTIAIIRIVGLSIIFFVILLLIASVVPRASLYLQLAGALVSIALIVGGIWWNTKVYGSAKTFLTDRRVLRIEVSSPFFQTKRALFWSEALKAKGFAPNIFYRMLGIGTVVVEPQMSDHEDVRIDDAALYEDLANYIDKLLYIIKNTPAELSLIRPFVPKPRGARDTNA